MGNAFSILIILAVKINECDRYSIFLILHTFCFETANAEEDFSNFLTAVRPSCMYRAQVKDCPSVLKPIQTEKNYFQRCIFLLIWQPQGYTSNPYSNIAMYLSFEIFIGYKVLQDD